MVWGSCRIWLASSRMSSLKVAENSRFCLSLGRRSRILRMSMIKPMSSIRSASSRTSVWTWERSTKPCCCKSSKRPGVAMMMSTPRCMRCICGFMLTPPYTTMVLSLRCLPNWRKDSSICAASSRVGASINARGMMRPRLFFAGCSCASRCKIGSAKPPVLPVPVCAPAIRSTPESTTGMACCWIGVGFSKPRSCTALSKAGANCKDSNVIRLESLWQLCRVFTESASYE